MTAISGLNTIYIVANILYPKLWKINPYDHNISLITDYSTDYLFAPQAAATIVRSMHYVILEKDNTDETLVSYDLINKNLTYVDLIQANNLTSGLWTLYP